MYLTKQVYLNGTRNCHLMTYFPNYSAFIQTCSKYERKFFLMMTKQNLI
jgi:hypothetical protein